MTFTLFVIHFSELVNAHWLEKTNVAHHLLRLAAFHQQLSSAFLLLILFDVNSFKAHEIYL